MNYCLFPSFDLFEHERMATKSRGKGERRTVYPHFFLASTVTALLSASYLIEYRCCCLSMLYICSFLHKFNS